MSDDEYMPLPGESSEESEEPEESEALEGDIELDEEEYLRGATTAEDEEEGRTDDEGRPLFREGQDPLSVLVSMEEQGATGRQPFELLAAANRRRRVRKTAAAAAAAAQEAEEAEEDTGRQAVFGAGVDDIWSGPLADKLGLDTGKARRKKRNKERWKRKAAKKGVKPRDLPEEVAAKLGEANLLYAMQKHEQAIALLMDVIRLAPNLPDPYHTLGLLHEAVGNSKKALDFYMIAAHITPKDIALWKRLAEMSTAHGLVKQAIYCLTQVLKRDKEDLDAKFDRALLFAELEDDKKAIDGLEQILAARPDHPEVAKALARLHHRAGQAAKAMGVIESHIQRFPATTDLTHINILAELYGELGRWEDVLALIQRAERDFCERHGGEEEEEGEEDVGLPVDLKVKAGVALAQLGQPDAAVEHFDSLLTEPVETFADLYADAGSVLLAGGRPEQALRFFRAMAEHPRVGGPEVWARMALCHRAMGDAAGALQVYEALMQRLTHDHPSYVDAMVAVAELHRELGQQAEADKVLDNVEALLRSHEALPGEQAAAVEAVLRRASILLACGKTDAYLDLALPVLGGTLRALERESEGGGAAGAGASAATSAAAAADPALRKRLRFIGKSGARRRRLESAVAATQPEAEGIVVGGYKRQDRRKQHIRELDEKVHALLAQVQTESEGEDEAGGGLVMRELLREEGPFFLLLQSGHVLLQEGRHAEARELMQAALDVCGRRWADRWKRDAVRLVLFEAAFAQRDFTAAQAALRAACARWPYSPVVWNAYARHLTETGSIKQSVKHLQPLRSRHPASLPLMLMLGHCHLLGTQYGEALGEYFHAWRLKPDEPLVLLCIAAALVNQATTRRVPDRHRAVLQAFAFLQEYSRLRQNSQEAAYNIARAAHHLNLLHIAVPYYEKALVAAPPQASPFAAAAAVAGGGGRGSPAACELRQRGGEEEEAQGVTLRYDLRREAAYNLSLIYKSSGADELAREVLREHLTV